MHGQLVISLDFELHWGVRDHTTVDEYRANLDGVRSVVPAMLARFRKREIHVTWATVGLLFARTQEEALRYAPARCPSYQRPELDPYAELRRAGADERVDPYHFAGSLVDQIAGTPHQELATHTYSHFYCLEPGPTLSEFEDDIAAARSIGATHGDVTRSIVFPRNQFSAAHLDSLCRSGTVAFRGNPTAWFWEPVAASAETRMRRALRLADAYIPTGWPTDVRAHRHNSGLINVPATRFLRPWTPGTARFEAAKRRRICQEMTRAARRGGLCHLWWHPHNFGRYPAENLAGLDELLDCFEGLRARHGMQSLSMAEAAAQVA